MITARDFDILLADRVFRPFRIVQADGAAFEIRHPREIMVTPRYVTVGLDPAPQSLYFERQAIINMIHILRLEELPETAAPAAAEA